MDKLYVLKHKNGKYYSDGEFIETENKQSLLSIIKIDIQLRFRLQ